MKRALLFATTAMVAGFGIAAIHAAAQDEAAGRNCSYRGVVYSPGERLAIDGVLMVCDGQTGTWVPVEGDE